MVPSLPLQDSAEKEPESLTQEINFFFPGKSFVVHLSNW